MITRRAIIFLLTGLLAFGALLEAVPPRAGRPAYGYGYGSYGGVGYYDDGRNELGSIEQALLDHTETRKRLMAAMEDTEKMMRTADGKFLQGLIEQSFSLGGEGLKNEQLNRVLPEDKLRYRKFITEVADYYNRNKAASEATFTPDEGLVEGDFNRAQAIIAEYKQKDVLNTDSRLTNEWARQTYDQLRVMLENNDKLSSRLFTVFAPELGGAALYKRDKNQKLTVDMPSTLALTTMMPLIKSMRKALDDELGRVSLSMVRRVFRTIKAIMIKVGLASPLSVDRIDSWKRLVRQYTETMKQLSQTSVNDAAVMGAFNARTAGRPRYDGEYGMGPQAVSDTTRSVEVIDPAAQDYYDLLGIDNRQAPARVIKDAFTQCMREVETERARALGDDDRAIIDRCDRLCVALRRAYTVLKDPELREGYDLECEKKRVRIIPVYVYITEALVARLNNQVLSIYRHIARRPGRAKSDEQDVLASIMMTLNKISLLAIDAAEEGQGQHLSSVLCANIIACCSWLESQMLMLKGIIDPDGDAGGDTDRTSPYGESGSGYGRRWY